MPYHILNLEEAAERLCLTAAELERLVKDGEMPFERRGRRLVFRKNELDEWASQRILSATLRRRGELERQAFPARARKQPGDLLLPQLVGAGQVEAALPARTRASVIREMAALAGRTGWVHDAAELVSSLEAREALCSTGMPGGVAFLHPRSQASSRFERSFIVLGRTIQAIHFGAPDGRPTELFFLLCNRDDRQHLQLLARLCLLAQRTGLLPALRSARDADAMRDCLLAAEQEAVSPGLVED